MLHVCLVITALHVRRFEMEENTSRYECQWHVYWISSYTQPKRDGPPAWKFVEGTMMIN